MDDAGEGKQSHGEIMLQFELPLLRPGQLSDSDASVFLYLRTQVWVPLIAFPATAQVVPEPLGVVLVFSCWNVPLGKALFSSP